MEQRYIATTVSFRPSERAVIEQIAEEREATLSSVVRSLVRAEAKRRGIEIELPKRGRPKQNAAQAA